MREGNVNGVKRTGEAAHTAAPSKRAKLVHQNQSNDVTEIASSAQLQRLLVFSPASIHEFRSGIRSFKQFLESICYAEEASDTTQQKSILKQYLETQHPRHKDALFLSNLFSAWNFGSGFQKDDFLVSDVIAILALLLKTVSVLIDFRELSLLIGRSVVSLEGVKLLKSGLEAPKQRENIISPCLRLLTEITSLDGGSLCEQIYLNKSALLDANILSRLLGLHGATKGQAPAEVYSRPTVRSNVIRFLLASLRFQSLACKKELLQSPAIVKALFSLLRYDSAKTLRVLFLTLKQHVLLDKAVDRSTKTKLFGDYNLSHIASLYSREASNEEDSVVEITHEFLLFACTDPAAEILRSPADWSTRKKRPPTADMTSPGVMSDVDSDDEFPDTKTTPTVRNERLAAFALNLRPYSSLKQSELLLAIFKAAPELVANYFARKRDFSFDPKLTATWTGYAAFLFDVVALPLPDSFRSPGLVRPPATSILLQNILPAPLTRQTVTRCLNQQSELVTFFVLRVLIAALQKLAQCCNRLQENSSVEDDIWQISAQNLAERFSQRCVHLKDVLAAFKKTSRNSNRLLHEAYLHFFSLYYQTLPDCIGDTKFDVAMPLQNALDSYNTSSQGPPDTADLRELTHLLQIASYTPETRWFGTTGSRKLSTFGTLLKIVASNPAAVSQDMIFLISSICQDCCLFDESSMEKPSWCAFLASFEPGEKWTTLLEVYRWVDDLCARGDRQGLKYVDMLQQMQNDYAKGENDPEKSRLSLLWMVIVEQWPFAVSNRSESVLDLARWVARFKSHCIQVGESSELLDVCTAKMLQQTATTHANTELTKLLTLPANDAPSLALKDILETAQSRAGFNNSRQQDTAGSEDDAASSEVHYNFEALAPSIEPPTQGLHTWRNLSVTDAVTSGAISRLILCLSSPHAEVRRQANTNLHMFLQRLKEHSPETTTNGATSVNGMNAVHHTRVSIVKSDAYDDAPQIMNAIETLLHTVRKEASLEQQPLPFSLTVYAAMATKILADPTHQMYEKINTFHLKGPKWDIVRLPQYWTRAVLQSPASETLTSDMRSRHRTSDWTSTPAFVANAATNGNARSSGFEIPALTEDAPGDLHTPAHLEYYFLLAYLYESARTAEDIEIFRSNNVFEPLLALANTHDNLPLSSSELIAALLARITAIPGGSTMLITRYGILTWLQQRISALRDREFSTQAGAVMRDNSRSLPKDSVAPCLMSTAGLSQLAIRLWDTCDHDWVEKWSHGEVAEQMKRLRMNINGTA